MSNTFGVTAHGQDLERYRVTAEFRDECTVQWDTDYKSGSRTSRTWENAKPLGQGTFGHVRQEKRQDVRGDWHYRAVKVCALDRLRGARVDYTRELSALAALSTSRHCGLFVTLTAWWMNNANLYIAMEYIGNGDLSGYIDSSLTEEDAKEITRDILTGLEVLHREGITHRDIKPQNILVVQRRPEFARWWVKIGDFGISKRIMEDSSSELRTQLGTRPYCAPEILGYLTQHEASVYDNKVDMWSLGCLIYNMGSHGRKPFSEADLVRYCDGTLNFSRLEGLLLFTTHGKSLTKSLLRSDPKHRPSASEAAEHPWFTSRSEQYFRHTSQSTALDSAQAPKIVPNQKQNYNSFLDSTTLTQAAFDRKSPAIPEPRYQRPQTPDWTPRKNSPAVPEVRSQTPDGVSATQITPSSNFPAAPESQPEKYLTSATQSRSRSSALAALEERYQRQSTPATQATYASSFWAQISKMDLRPAKEWTHTVAMHGHKATVNAVAFSPKGGLVASASDQPLSHRLFGYQDDSVRLWDVATGKELHTFRGHTKSVESVAFSPDGDMLASGSCDETVRIWSVPGRVLVRTMSDHGARVRAIDWSRNGQVIAAGSEHNIKVWNASNGHLLSTLGSSQTWISSLSFSLDSKFLAAGQRRGEVEIWEIAEARAVRTITGDDGSACELSFPSNLHCFASAPIQAGIGVVNIRSIDDGRVLRTLKTDGIVSAVAWSPNGRLLATSSMGYIHLWDAETGSYLKTLKDHDGVAYSMAFSPDGTLLVSGSTDNTVRLWDLKSHGIADEYLRPA